MLERTCDHQRGEKTGQGGRDESEFREGERHHRSDASSRQHSPGKGPVSARGTRRLQRTEASDSHRHDHQGSTQNEEIVCVHGRLASRATRNGGKTDSTTEVSAEAVGEQRTETPAKPADLEIDPGTSRRVNRLYTPNLGEIVTTAVRLNRTPADER